MLAQERPINLDVTKYKFPVMAIASILHRITGVIVFLFLPWMLYCLQQSLFSADNFTALRITLASPLPKLGSWLLLSALIYHLLAGIRHLIMDLGWGESLRVARVTATLVIVLAVVIDLLIGVWLWW